ncbi:MAG: hypothetical protein HQ503_12740 [Rhodospirillales bacterium]|nr:hypothetical protein [Rhodospirillales bacterium]
MDAMSARDRSATLWYRSHRQSRNKIGQSAASNGDHPASPALDTAAVNVSVRLFGILSAIVPENPIHMTMTQPVAIGDVIARVQAVAGPAFFANRSRTFAAASPSCRVFADGFPIEDVEAILEPKDGSIDLEIILVLAYEGG